MEIFFDIVGFILQGIGYFFAGIVGIIIFAVIFGNKVNWKFEAEGYCDACANSKIRVKLRDVAKKGQSLEIRGQLKDEFRNKDIDVLLNRFKIARIDKAQNNGSNNRMNADIQINPPDKGDMLAVLIDNKEIYSEKLA